MYLKQQASSDQMGHRPDSNVGENVYYAYDSEKLTLDADLVNRCVDKWYAEQAKPFIYDSPNGTPGCGHFTQVVWKNSQRLGCGCAFTDAT